MTLVTLLLLSLCAAFVASRTFRAAVYEHAVHIPEIRHTPTRAEALQFMEPNLHDYEKYAAMAHAQGADILVTPEDGIYSMSQNRLTITNFMETIPDPRQTTWTPCDAPLRVRNVEVQRRLSCMARRNNLYLVANFGDLQPCTSATDPDCPTDGHYQFNTDLVFAPNGSLIAKYHKKHLFFEHQFDEPKTADNVVFTTPFGQFAVFTCYDILFEKPTIDVIEKLGSGNVVLPTAWIDGLPLLAAIQFHSAFAMGMGINLLAANIHLPKYKFQGSGIYTPHGAASFYYNDTVGPDGGKLLVSDVDVVDTPRRSSNHISLNPTTTHALEFTSVLSKDTYRFVPINNPKGDLQVCFNNFCCRATYEAALDQTELYALGAFEGVHSNYVNYYIEVCTIVKCASRSRASCGSPTKISKSVFKHLELQGTFTTTYVFPEVLMSNTGSLTIAQNELSYRNQTLRTVSSLPFPLLSASLFGRRYDKDGIKHSGFLIAK